MKQYIELLKDIQNNGTWKEPARPGMPRTKEVFGRMMKFDLQAGFPLLTTKRMFTKGIVAELLWFLSGQTNIQYLLQNDCHIWDGDAYKYYRRLGSENPYLLLFTKEEFIQQIQAGNLIQPFATVTDSREAREYTLGTVD